MTRTILHFAQDDDTSGFFPQLARWHDRNRFRMIFGTLGPTAPWLREYMQGQGVACFEAGCLSRLEYGLGFIRLLTFIRAEHVDIFHAHLFNPSVVGLSAAVAARVPARVLTRHHSDYHTRIRRPLHVGVDRLCSAMSHAVIAVSRHTRDHLLSVEGAPPSKVHLVHNGIDFDRVMVSDPAAPARLRAELAPAGTALLVTAARLHPEKGYEYLFDALPLLKERVGRPFVLAVVGAGPFEADYRARAARLGMTGCIRFLGFRKDLPDLMCAADIFVLASLAEAFGLVLAEALYLGTPVVATTAGAIPEIVEDGVSGRLVPPADSEALAAALAELIDDPGRRRRMAGAGRAKVAREFRFDEMMRSYERIYDQLAPAETVSPHA